MEVLEGFVCDSSCLTEDNVTFLMCTKGLVKKADFIA